MTTSKPPRGPGSSNSSVEILRRRGFSCNSSFANQRGLAMPKPVSLRYPAIALGVWVCVGFAHAQESLVTYKSLSPGIALELAQAALADCQRRGYQAAVAIVDRFGVVQVVLRDRYAGPHTPATASGKAWTARLFAAARAVLSPSASPA